MYYLATYPNDFITYRSINIILSAHSNTAYINETYARSRLGSHIFCSDNDPIPRDNGPVLSLSQIINMVMSSASEAKLSGIFVAAKVMVLTPPVSLNHIRSKHPKSTRGRHLPQLRCRWHQTHPRNCWNSTIPCPKSQQQTPHHPQLHWL